MGSTRDAERTRSEVLEVATRVFAEDGFAGARVDVIAARTRTTKRMIYYYFGGKEGLYLAVLEQAYAGIRRAEQELDLEGLSPVDGVRRLAELTLDHHQAHPDFVRLVSLENLHGARRLAQLDSLAAMSSPVVSVLADLLARGRDEGAFRDDVDAVDVHMVISAYAVFPVANQHTFGHLFGRDLHDAGTRDRLRSMIGDVVVDWLCAPSGRS